MSPREALARGWRGAFPVVSLCLIVALIVLVTTGGSEVLQRHVTEMLVNLVLVVGLYVFAGTSGVLSFGQMSFMAIGAYSTAILTIPVVQKQFLLPDLPGFLPDVHLSGIPAAVAAGGVAAVFAVFIGLVICRLSGLAASLAMFAVLVIVHEVARNWDAVTRGSRTMIGVPVTVTPGVALGWALVVIVIAYLFQRSAAGLRLRASREDEFAARSIGVSIPRERFGAFVLSGFIVGIGGYLYAQYQGAFTPNAFFTHITFITIAMLVIGGTKSLSGAVVGAIVVSLLTNLFNSIEDGFTLGPISFGGRDGLSDMALAAFILIILALRPEGITKGRELRWGRPAWLKRRAAAPPGDGPVPAADDARPAA